MTDDCRVDSTVRFSDLCERVGKREKKTVVAGSGVAYVCSVGVTMLKLIFITMELGKYIL